MRMLEKHRGVRSTPMEEEWTRAQVEDAWGKKFMLMRTKLTLGFLSIAFVLLGVIGVGTWKGIEE